MDSVVMEIVVLDKHSFLPKILHNTSQGKAFSITIRDIKKFQSLNMLSRIRQWLTIILIWVEEILTSILITVALLLCIALLTGHKKEQWFLSISSQNQIQLWSLKISFTNQTVVEETLTSSQQAVEVLTLYRATLITVADSWTPSEPTKKVEERLRCNFANLQYVKMRIMSNPYKINSSISI